MLLEIVIANYDKLMKDNTGAEIHEEVAMDIPVVDPAYHVMRAVGDTLAAILAIIAVTSPAYFWMRRNIRNFNKDFKVLANFSEVWKEMSELMEVDSKRGNQIVIRNIGLDLEIILPDLYKFIERQTKTVNVLHLDYKGLVVNPASPYIKDLIDAPPSNIRSSTVEATMGKIKKDFAQDFANYPSIQLRVFSYDVPIVIHGVLITSLRDNGCDKHLMLGFTELRQRKMRGSDKPYIYLKYSTSQTHSSATEHYFAFFEEWFEYYFSQAVEPKFTDQVSNLNLLDQKQ